MNSNGQKGSPASRRQPPPAHGTTAAALARGLLAPQADGGEPAVRAFANFFENSPDPILLFDASGEIVARNQRATLFWDGSREIIPPSVVAEVVEVAQRETPIRHSGKKQLVEVQTTRGQRFFLPNIFRLLSPPANVEKAGGAREEIIACVMKDETAWIRSETIRNNLLASISHELNTPLTSARVALYLLAEQRIGELNADQAEMVDRAKEDLNREIATIRNVLALMRTDSIEGAGACEDTHNLHEVLDEVLIELREQTDALDLTVNRFDSEQAPLVRMEHDTIRLMTKQIVSCIIKYVKKGAVIDVITIADEKDNLLKLVSSDPALIDALPDNLFALPMESSSLRKLGCVDLGLRVVHEIIRHRGGEISTEQTPEAAVLTLRFPRPDKPRG